MGFRARPREIGIPTEGDPFANDLLGRKAPAESLANLIRSVEGPCAVSVDAAWGNGKTTFLKLLAQHLRNEGFPVVAFNAWETDFSGDPFLALSESIASGLEERADGSTGDTIGKFRKQANKILPRVPMALIRAGAAMTGVGAVVEQAENLVATETGDRLKAFKDARETVAGFTKALKEMAAEIYEDGRPLVVTIDELDRCRPSYAVELLEVAKHLFSVDRVVFVLAVNRAELEHSVKALYGAGFDARGYLGRFFDVAFRLPEPDRGHFIRALGASMQFPHQNYTAYAMTTAFFENSNLTLRQIQQAMYYIGLVRAITQNDDVFNHIDYHAAIIARALAPTLYYSFCEGRASDRELVEHICENVNRKSSVMDVRNRSSLHILKVSIICAYRQFHSGDYPATSSSSPLLDHYADILKNEKDNVPELVQHARDVKSDVEMHSKSRTSNFHYFAKQIELYEKRN